MSAVRSELAVGEGWQYASLGKLLPLKYGKSLPSPLRDPHGTHPVYGSSGVVGTHSAALTTGPTLIVGRKGNVGAIHYSAVPCWPIDTAYFVEAPAGHNLRYYKYLLESLNLVKLDRSTAIPGLSRDDYNAVEVSVAPPEQQRKIVAEIEKQFSRLDEAVANLQRVKANLKRYKASVLNDAVEGRLVPTEAELARREGRSFETGEQMLKNVRCHRKAAAKGKRRELLAPELGALIDAPEGWVWTTCDAAIDAIDAGASFKCVEQPPRDGEIGVLKVSAVSWGTYNEEESKTCIDVKRIEESYLVNPGDFLFSRANTIELVGACVIVGTVRKQLMLSDKTLRFKVSDCVLPNWLLVCLRTKFGRSEIESLSTGNQESMRNIGQERIRQIRMPLPPLREQERIVAEVDRRLSLVRGVESEVDANLKRAQALRQSTLNKCFSISS